MLCHRPSRKRGLCLSGDSLERFWHWIVFAVPAAILLVAGLFIFITLPPRTVTMATGPAGGAYHELGLRYREILARSGVRLRRAASTISRGFAIAGRACTPHSSRAAQPQKKSRQKSSRSAPCFSSRSGCFIVA